MKIKTNKKNAIFKPEIILLKILISNILQQLIKKVLICSCENIFT